MARNDKSAGTKPDTTIVFPEGRLINNSVFIKDQYDANSAPLYKVEFTVDMEGPELDRVIDRVFDLVDQNWNLGGNFKLDIDATAEDLMPKAKGGTGVMIVDTFFLYGDELAAKREAKGKPGEAYKGKFVVRADTKYNADGADAPGGIAVYGPDKTPITILEQGQVYNGMNCIVACNIGFWENDKTGHHAVKCYLKAMQKTGDNEKLTAPVDHSTLFEARAVGRDQAAGAGPRRGRKG